MSVQARLDAELVRLHLEPLNVEQVECLTDPARLDEAAAMLADLRDRCMVRLPIPEGVSLAGPCGDEQEAREVAESRARDFSVVAVDEMATDASRSTGTGNEFYVTGYAHGDAAIVVAERDRFLAVWVAGAERAG